MKTVIVLFNVDKKPIKESVSRELLWHDNIRGELLTFYGGKLGFEYKEDEYLVKMGKEERDRRGIKNTYRMLPKVEELKVVNYNNLKYNTNEVKVRKWFNNYVNYNDTEAYIVASTKNNITVDIEDDYIDDFLYQAERQGFRTVI